jgi:hypothetical protein
MRQALVARGPAVPVDLCLRRSRRHWPAQYGHTPTGIENRARACNAEADMRALCLVFGLVCTIASGCSNDGKSSSAPSCPESQLDAGDFWGTGMCTSGGVELPCCPDQLPTCEADSSYPACLRTSSSALCVCCERTWTCVSGSSPQ